MAQGEYTSEFTGEQIDALLKKVDQRVSTPAPAEDKLITSGGVYTGLEGKVDKEAGKGLSTNDYTNTEKSKLGALPTSSELEAELGGKADKVASPTADNIVAMDANGNIKDGGVAKGDVAKKSEMSFTDGTGANADKTTVQLKSGTTKQVLIKHQDITGKADKDTDAVVDDIAKFDSDGNPIDSGVSIDELSRRDAASEFAREVIVSEGEGEEVELVSKVSESEKVAEVQEVKGKSLAWNNLCKNGNFADGSNWLTNNSSISTSGNVCTLLATAEDGRIYQEFSGIVGHKYLFVVSLKGTTNNTPIALAFSSINEFTISTSWKRYSSLITFASGASFQIRDMRSSGWDNIQIKDVMLIDLTLMFGAGKEPTSAAKFEAEYPNAYYPYNSGKLLNNAVQRIEATSLDGKKSSANLGLNKIRLVSPNVWDEEWEVGGVVWNTGADYAVTDRIRSKNYFPILPNTSYYITNKGNGNVGICFYDANKQRISANDAAASGSSFTSPDGACYARIATNASYGATYGNNICLNISNPMFNGKYFPHELYAYGVKSAGSVYDEIKNGKFYMRVGEMNLAQQSWTYNTTYEVWAITTFNGLRPANNYTIAQLIASFYTPDAVANLIDSDNRKVNTIGVSDGGALDVYNGSSSSSPSGTLNYALATELVFDLYYPLNDLYKTFENGTESIAPATDTDGNPVTTPFYGMLKYNRTLKEQLADKVEKNESEDTVSVGSAQAVLGGPIAQEFTFAHAPSNADGAARIERFKGDTKAVNQLVKNGNFADTSMWNASNVTITASNNIGSVTATRDGDNYVRQAIPMVVGHKYLFTGEVNGATAGATIFYLFFGTPGTSAGQMLFQQSAANVWEKRTCFFTCANNSYNEIRLQNAFNGTTNQYRNVKIIDLTLMFGAGNEPSTVAEFEALFPLSYYAYNAGQLKNNETKAIESTGRNIWDGTGTSAYGVVGSTGALNSTSAGLVATDYIRVSPSTTYYFSSSFGLGSGNYGYAWYDANKNYISGSAVGVTAGFTAASPSNAVYLRASVKISETDSAIINKSDSHNGVYEPYRKVVSNINLDNIKVKSPNIWDEEWEVGTIDATTGENTGHDSWIRSKNYIPCVENVSYYFQHSANNFGIRWYDKNKNYIGYVAATSSSAANTTPANCHFMRFTQNVSSYANNITINVSQAGINGNYYPHGILTFKGLKSAGSVYDEIRNGKFIRRVGDVDLGSLSWVLGSATYLDFNVSLNDCGNNNLTCSKYVTTNSPSHSGIGDKQIGFNDGNGLLYAKDSTYSDPASFKNGVSGVMLNYQLASPEIFELAEPIADAFFVGEGGQMKALPEGTSENPIAPFAAEIAFPTDPELNAATGILEALKTANKIASYTITWDATTGKYGYSVS